MSAFVRYVERPDIKFINVGGIQLRLNKPIWVNNNLRIQGEFTAFQSSLRINWLRRYNLINSEVSRIYDQLLNHSLNTVKLAIMDQRRLSWVILIR